MLEGRCGFYLDRTFCGWGLFAARHFVPGEFILEFSGRLISQAQTLELGSFSMYPQQIGLDAYIDCQPPAAFLNHSCSPTAGMSGDRHLRALRALSPGHEITFDYSCSMWGDADGGLPCLCGSPHCRGRIDNFESLPRAVQAQRLASGQVSAYIIAELQRLGWGAQLSDAQ